jgi:hypothetical protein
MIECCPVAQMTLFALSKLVERIPVSSRVGIVAMSPVAILVILLRAGQMLSIKNPEPPCDPKVRRQMVHLIWLSAAIMFVLLGSMLASFSGLLPAWVSAASCAATGLVSYPLTGRAESLRKRLRTKQER